MSMSFGGGGTRQVTNQVNVPGPTAQESQLQQLNLTQAQQQAQMLQDAYARQKALENLQMQQYGGVGQGAAQNLQGYMNGNIINPQAMQAIQQMFEPLRTQGMADLQRAAQQAADRRGMTISDTPIGQPYLDQIRRFQNDLLGQQAQAYLNQGNTQFNQANTAAQFTQGLAQQAQQNRLALGTAQPGSYGLQNAMTGARVASAGNTQGLQNVQNPNFGVGLNQAGDFMKSIPDIYGGLYGNPNSLTNIVKSWWS